MNPPTDTTILDQPRLTLTHVFRDTAQGNVQQAQQALAACDTRTALTQTAAAGVDFAGGLLHLAGQLVVEGSAPHEHLCALADVALEESGRLLAVAAVVALDEDGSE